MARNQKDRTQSGNPVEGHLPRVKSDRQSWKGGDSVSNVTEMDTASFAFSFGLGVELLLQGQPTSSQVSGAFGRLCNNALSSRDLLGFIDACSLLRDGLVQTGRWETNPSKGLKRRWVRGLVMAIEHAIEASLIVHPSVEFDRVVTFLGWLKRLPVCIRDERESIALYRQCDERVRDHLVPNKYVHELREIWEEWFSDFRITPPFLPRHGSGSTADAGRVRHDKWQALQVDTVARVGLRFPSLECALDYPIGPSNRTSKVVFVPKQAGKDRAICMEPAWLQFLQQGVARQLIAYTHSKGHPPTQIRRYLLARAESTPMCVGLYEGICYG